MKSTSGAFPYDEFFIKMGIFACYWSSFLTLFVTVWLQMVSEEGKDCYNKKE